MSEQKRQHVAKRLGDLVAGIDSRYVDLSVAGLALDSRKIVAGDLFLAYPGHSSDSALDGRDFIAQAVTGGAVAVLAERDENWMHITQFDNVPVIPVEDLSARVSAIADCFYGHPSHSIPVMAVTGTNGKTSCTQLIMQLLNCLNKSCAVIGTLGSGVNGNFDSSVNTTPDAITIQRNLAKWCEQHVDAVAMEASSHGLEQYRVASVRFKLALFTNLSRDHLDYHGSMQAYAAAKSKLFTLPGLEIAVINIDDSYAQTLIDLMAPTTQLVGYSTQDNKADFYVSDVRYHPHGVNAVLHCAQGQFPLQSHLLGAFNLSNLLGVIAALSAMGCEVEQMLQKIAQLRTVSGRMERIDIDTDIGVVVDYAHTPDALEQALTAMRLHCGGKLWCVFGCGGDRDHGKRQHMGAVAQANADHVVVTSDNPRSESPNAIIDDILCGIDVPTQVEVDRAAAIAFAVKHAKPGDSVLIAGKGHEEYQHIGDQRLPFSDIDQARQALVERGRQ